ncbi:hypothetical protein [Peptostreptococcus anaerobius]|uniref:hypothetical protein n=1 Tax=Peptostreptococcus anaerobius TaxID=1261 RepID=UPI00254F56A6|nr:hypothetical protein [Peptostreptococcus anaerobius]MDK8278323.1 hypothetical protein [Peptostreptococcus anaerobius]
MKKNEKEEIIGSYKGGDNSILSKIAGASKEEYYNSHKKEIDKYQRVRKAIEKLTGI